MADTLRNNPIARRLCILYEFLGKMSIEEGYKNLCERLGADVMEYSEFDFWYKRFDNGNFNLNHDRNEDPKPRLLFDMPTEILTIIVNKLDVMDRLLTRKASKLLKSLADNWNPGFKNLSIVISDDSSILRIDEDRIHYDNNNQYNKELKKGNCMITYNETKAVINEENHAKLSAEAFVSVLTNENLYWEEVTVYCITDKFYKNMRSKLESLDKKDFKKIRVKNVKFTTAFEQEEMTILPYLEPGTLENITLDVQNMKKELQLEEIKARILRIGQLEQCKKAKMLTFASSLKLFDSFPIESFLHFPRFTISFRDPIEMGTVIRFKEVLLTFADLELFKLTTHFKFDVEAIKNELVTGSNEVPDRPNVRHFPIPNSNQFFEIEVADFSIRIERIS